MGLRHQIRSSCLQAAAPEPCRSFLFLLPLIILFSFSTDSPAGVSVRYEYTHDSFRYEFHNPSIFNTPETVPHFFVQKYSGNQHWAVVEAEYRLLNSLWQTTAGFTPSHTASGDDVDTFFQPDGNIIQSGTTGKVSIRSFRLNQRIEIWSAPQVALVGGIHFRRDRSEFHPGDAFITQTKPPSETRWITYDEETTISDLYSVSIAAKRSQAWNRWQVAGSLEWSPLLVASLTTILPQKYPGREIVFQARAFALEPEFQVRYSRFCLSARYTFARGYSQDNNFRRDAWSLTFGIRL